MIIRAILNSDGPLVDETGVQTLHLKLEGPVSFGQADGPTQAPFSRRDLAIVLRALDVNRSARSAFTSEEVQRLREWGVVRAFEHEATPEGWVALDESDIDGAVLLDLAQSRLYATLFPEEKQRALLQSAAATTPLGEAIHIRLELATTEVNLLQCPWEVLCDARPERWNGRRVSVSRYPRFEQPAFKAIDIERLRVLVITSRPRGLTVGAGNDRDSIARAVSIDRVDLIDLPQATVRALSEYLIAHPANEPHVIHFDGHGVFGRKCVNGHITTNASMATCTKCGAGVKPDFAGWLAFEAEDGGLNWLSGDDLATHLIDHGVQLVVLSACQAGVARRADDVFNGVAQSLLRSVPAVVASQFRLDWIGALRFADYFYRRVMTGEPLVEALDRARQALYGQDDLEREWYRTALYLRYHDNSGGQIFNPLVQREVPPVAEAPVVFLHNINPAPGNIQQADFVLDWSRHYDFSKSPRRAPSAAMWEQELMPELNALADKIGQRGLIHLRSTAALPAGLAFGYVFREVGRYHLAVEQITSGRPTRQWRTDEPPQADRPTPKFKVTINDGRADAIDGIVIIRALPNSPLQPLRQAVLQYVAQSDQFPAPIEYDRAAVRELLSEGFNSAELKNLCFDNAPLDPVLNSLGDGMSKTKMVQALMEFAEQRLLMETLLAAARQANQARYNQLEQRLRLTRYRAVLTLDADFVERDRVLESWEALPLARSSRWELMDFIGQKQVSRLHVFLVTPLALAVFLGHQWNAIDCPIRCYEWIRGKPEYAPACLIGA